MSSHFREDYSWAAERRPLTAAGTRCRRRSEETRPPSRPDETQFNLDVTCNVVKQPRGHCVPRWFIEAHRQASGATREVIHAACCYLHQPAATNAVGDEDGKA